MKPLELFRLAVAEIGDASSEALSGHLEKKHGVKIAPAFIPVFKATLKEMEKTSAGQLIRRGWASATPCVIP